MLEYESVFPNSVLRPSDKDGYIIHDMSGKEVFIGKYGDLSQIVYDRYHHCYIAYISTLLEMKIYKRFSMTDDGKLFSLKYDCKPVDPYMSEWLSHSEMLVLEDMSSFNEEVEDEIFEILMYRFSKNLKKHREKVIEQINHNLETVITSYNVMAEFFGLEKKEIK